MNKLIRTSIDSCSIKINYIKYPLISDKTTRLLEDNSYSFIVDAKADKLTIKTLIEFLFNVKVIKVNTCHIPPKKVGFKQLNRFKSHYKKAIVKLQTGNKINLFNEES